MLRTQLHEIVESVLPHLAQKFGYTIPTTCSFQIEKPKMSAHGDFSIDLAFHLSKVFKRSPWDIAQEIVKLLHEKITQYKEDELFIQEVTVARPGFVNFSISKHAWQLIVHFIKGNEKTYGASFVGKGQRVILEYVSANPTGPLTIAHGRQACLGDTLANVFEKAGYTVCREYYLNDAGRQINLLGESTRARYMELLGEKCPLPEDGYRGEYVRALAAAIIKDYGDKFRGVSISESLSIFSEYATNYLMKGIKKDLADIGVHFDEYYSEQSLQGKKIEYALNCLHEKGFVYEQDGALWFASTQFGDDKDRVLRKSDGSYTYLVPDIAYHREKFERGFHRFINLLGPDHHGYIKRLKAAVAALGFDMQTLDVLIVQLTALYKQGKPFRMSTRAGDFVTLKQLVDEVGADATRFFFLMRKMNSHLNFDLELAQEKSQENPVFYLQYAHARIASLLQYSGQAVESDVDLSCLKEDDEFELIKLLHEFPTTIVQTARVLEPYRLVDYLKDVATLFHKFYSHHRVVTQDASLTKARLLLCDCVRIVIRNGLALLGVSHPDQM